MNESNTYILKQAFPTVFGKLYGFECGDGWFQLIAQIATFIANTTKHCYAVQVKEKFGTLRFYVHYDVDINGEQTISDEQWRSIQDYIDAVEAASAHVCEDCGIDLTSVNKESQKKLGYWIRNICKDCGEKHRKRKFDKPQSI